MDKYQKTIKFLETIARSAKAASLGNMTLADKLELLATQKAMLAAVHILKLNQFGVEDVLRA